MTFSDDVEAMLAAVAGDYRGTPEERADAVEFVADVALWADPQLAHGVRQAWRVRFDRDAADLVAAAQWLSSDGADAGEVPDVLVSWCREVFRASPAFRERLLECLDTDDDGGVL